jgi:glycosyltransferase involved in cell wall biosynthesis
MSPNEIGNIRGVSDSIGLGDGASPDGLPHIAVCVCTYKRPILLKRLLKELNQQTTGGLFTYSITVVDNDAARTGEGTVAELQPGLAVPIQYLVETNQSIALARNMAIGNSTGELIALIDDDEYPIPTWLLELFQTCNEYKVDGVLGPVLRRFDEAPPAWLEKSSLLDRKVNPTGMKLAWREGRTGNVLMKREVLGFDPSPFRPEFIAGSDADFFRRKIEGGYRFVWSAKAEVFEVLPPFRWTRTYFVKRALLGGAMEPQLPTFGMRDIAKSVIAVPLYTLALPFAFVAGQYHFMKLLVKLCNHLGKLLAAMGIHLIRDQYVTN